MYKGIRLRFVMTIGAMMVASMGPISAVVAAEISGKDVTVSFGNATNPPVSFSGNSAGKPMYYTNSDDHIVEQYVGTPNTSRLSERDFANGDSIYVVGTDCATCRSIMKTFLGDGGTVTTIIIYSSPK